jgi:hypothetical protein
MTRSCGLYEAADSRMRSPEFSSTPHHDFTLRIRKATIPRTHRVLSFKFGSPCILLNTVQFRCCVLLQAFNPPAPEAPTESPLRFGILGAAGIAPAALIYPVKNHPDAVVKAVAARDQGRADAFAKKHGIPKAYSGPGAYQSAWVYISHQLKRVDHKLKNC